MQSIPLGPLSEQNWQLGVLAFLFGTCKSGRILKIVCWSLADVIVIFQPQFAA